MINLRTFCVCSVEVEIIVAPAHRLPLCLVAVVLGMWMGSFRAPRRWTVRSWMTSLMCLIQSCLFSKLDA